MVPWLKWESDPTLRPEPPFWELDAPRKRGGRGVAIGSGINGAAGLTALRFDINLDGMALFCADVG